MSIKKLVRRLRAIITGRHKPTPIVRCSLTLQNSIARPVPEVLAAQLRAGGAPQVARALVVDAAQQAMDSVLEIDTLRRRLSQDNPVLERPLEIIENAFIRDMRHLLVDVFQGDADG